MLKPVTLEADLLAALVSLGWCHQVETKIPHSVEQAIYGVVFAALNAGMRPCQPGRAYVPVSLEGIEAALVWGKPGEALSPESAGQALANVSKCAAQVGPEEMAGIN